MTAQPKKKRIVNRAYIRFVKTFPCMLSSINCRLPIDPHHTVPVSLGGSDYLAVPLCRHHHDIVQNNQKGYDDACYERIYTLRELWENELHPSPRVSRRSKPSVKLSVRHCPECQGAHDLPLSKVQIVRNEVKSFYCIRKRGMVGVE